MFGIVDQDYHMPHELLNEIGLSTFEYEQTQLELFETSTFEVHTFKYEQFAYKTLGITILRRGVIGVNQIGYL